MNKKQINVNRLLCETVVQSHPHQHKSVTNDNPEIAPISINDLSVKIVLNDNKTGLQMMQGDSQSNQHRLLIDQQWNSGQELRDL